MRSAKIKSREEIAAIVAREKVEEKTVGFTNGCFDILHFGHVRYLFEASELCDILVVGVNSNDSVRSLKGEKRPVNDEQSRLEVIAALQCVSYVTLFSEETPLELINILTPAVLFKGGDWTEDAVVGAEHVKSIGGGVEIIPYVQGFSTTELIKKLRETGE